MFQFTTSRFQHLYIHIFIYVYVNIRIYYMYINTWEHFLENLYQNDWKSSLRFWTLIPTQHNRERSTTRSRFDIFPRSLLRSLHRCQMILDACVSNDTRYIISHFCQSNLFFADLWPHIAVWVSQLIFSCDLLQSNLLYQDLARKQNRRTILVSSTNVAEECVSPL